MTKKVIVQYLDLQKEHKELQTKQIKLDKEIRNIRKRLEEIEAGETVRDRVRGGLGGMQSFTIEGVPTREYTEKKIELKQREKLMEERKIILSKLELEILGTVNEIERFIAGLEDSHMRRIINLRIVEKKSWNQVADHIGGGNTEDSVRMSFERFMKSNTCSINSEKV